MNMPSTSPGQTFFLQLVDWECFAQHRQEYFVQHFNFKEWWYYLSVQCLMCETMCLFVFCSWEDDCVLIFRVIQCLFHARHEILILIFFLSDSVFVSNRRRERITFLWWRSWQKPIILSQGTSSGCSRQLIIKGNSILKWTRIQEK